MTAKGVEDCWTSGELYERYVGRWSRPVAQKFLAWLDVGCGTGALTGTIAKNCAPRRLVGAALLIGTRPHFTGTLPSMPPTNEIQPSVRA